MATLDYNLLMFQTEGLQDRGDFEQIKALMAQRHPDIACFIYSIRLTPRDLYLVENDNEGIRPVTLTVDTSLPMWQVMASRPTLMFSPVPLELATPLGGYRLFAQHVSKFEEMRILAATGFPVPKTIMLTEAAGLDEGEWGPLVVVKAAEGRGGRTIRLMKTADAARLASGWQARHQPPMLVQQWIDTGPHINSYRAFTVLDSVAYLYKSAVIAETRIDAAAIGPGGINVSSNGQPRKLLVEHDPAVHALAQDICRQVTFTPSFGIDIIREHHSDKLFVVELNSGFPTWHLSSRYIQHFEASSDYFRRADLYAQYNALPAITDSLARAVRTLAC